MYRFIQQHSTDYPVAVLCDTLAINRSSYYAFASGQTYQPTAKKEASQRAIQTMFSDHKSRYGSRRIVQALRAKEEKVGRDFVRNTLSASGLVAIQPRSFVPRTTASRHTLGFSANLLLNQPAPSGTNQAWVSDITYIALASGQWAYLTVWMDLWSRRVVGWHLDNNMAEALIITAFRRAVLHRQPAPGLIAHSDRGGQYAGKAFRCLLTQHQCRQSMSRADDAYDNAFVESYWSRLKAELIESGAFLTLEDARLEIGEYIDNYYNTVRLHSALGYLSPVQFENQTKG
jgi:transposase InsO family protein